MNIGRETVQVWRTDLNAAELHLEILTQFLSEDERSRAARFHFEKDRRHWIAARGLLRVALGRLLEMPAASLHFDFGPFGKPFLKAYPLRFNISHTNSMMLMAFAWGREVGVDVEQWRNDFSPSELASQIFSESELHFLGTVPTEEQHRAFLVLWTAKEAYVKAHGNGLSFPLTRLTLLPPSSIGRQWLVQDKTADPEQPAFQLYSLTTGQDYLASLAVEAAPQTLQNETLILETVFELETMFEF